MRTLDEVRAALQDARLDLVAKATGLHRNTIADVRNNADANPRWDTLRKLNDYLDSRGR